MSQNTSQAKQWDELTLEEIIKKEKYSIKRGPWGSSIKKAFFVSEGYKVYQQQNVIYENFDLGDYYIDDEKFKELQDFEISSGDFLISCSGTIGAVSRVPSPIKKGIMNQALLKISIDEKKVLPAYFEYFSKSSVFLNKLLKKGGGMENIESVSKLKKIKFIFPKPHIQKKIIEKLDLVFNGINKYQNQILELQEENILYTHQLSSEIFYGLIWSVIHPHIEEKFDVLSNFITDTETRNPKKNENNFFKYVEIGGIDTLNKKIHSWREILGKDAPSRAKKVIRENDVIFGTTRPYYRNIAIIPKELNNEICSTGFCVLRSKNNGDLEPKFLFYFLQTDFAMKQILKNMGGGAYPAIGDKDVLEIKIPKISNTNQIKIIKKIENIKKSFNSTNSSIFETNILQNDNLSNIKKIKTTILDSTFSEKLFRK